LDHERGHQVRIDSTLDRPIRRLRAPSVASRKEEREGTEPGQSPPSHGHPFSWVPGGQCHVPNPHGCDHLEDPYNLLRACTEREGNELWIFGLSQGSVVAT